MSKRVCVYCASSERIDPEFRRDAIELGKGIAERGWTLVYGAGSVGLMGDIAAGALRAGGHVIGVIPGFMKERELDHPDIGELYVVPDMHRRKQMMIDLSDAFIALPGGTGTLEELTECLSFRRLGLHDGPIIVANWKNYYAPLLELLGAFRRGGFMPEDEAEVLDIVQDLPQIFACLDR